MTDTEKWNAVLENDDKYDGKFYYAVKSTGIFCRPSCKSKPPKRENVQFFDSPVHAETAGFRPCKRCRPDLAEYQPVREIAEKAKQLIEHYFDNKQELELKLNQIGVTQHRLAEIFKECYGTTVTGYLNGLRIEKAKTKLANTEEEVAGIAYSVGFESLSSFYRLFRYYTESTPSVYRKRAKDELHF